MRWQPGQAVRSRESLRRRRPLHHPLCTLGRPLARLQRERENARARLDEQVGVPFVRFRPNPDPKLNSNLHTYHAETEWLATRGLRGYTLNPKP